MPDNGKIPYRRAGITSDSASVSGRREITSPVLADRSEHRIVRAAAMRREERFACGSLLPYGVTKEKGKDSDGTRVSVMGAPSDKPADVL